MKFRNRK
jgi:hypothetical protein